VRRAKCPGTPRAATAVFESIHRAWRRVLEEVKRIVWVFAYLLFPALSALAHDPGLSTTQVAIRPDGIELTVGFAPTDVQNLLPSSARPAGGWKPADLKADQSAMMQLAQRLWEVGGDVGLAPARSASVALVENNSVIFTLEYPRPDGGRLRLRSLVLDQLPPGHRDFLTVKDEHGAIVLERLADAKENAFDIALSAAPAPTFWGFLGMGIEHIWTGYDHLLFLFGLLVVCRHFKSIFAIISCFTIAHSITLALATLKIVVLPSRVTEPAIAASILFVGLENLIRHGAEPKGRWALTFTFGLIHGFGFANALSDLGVGANGRGIAIPLFTFNLGVEIGQITIAAIVLPIVWRLRRNPGFVRTGVSALSTVVAAAGLYWFLRRTILA
jgi:hydrogenase/urease accessory protein HupE